ncbi:MAG: START domain-containing protein [Salinivirgaceae bacterium]|nr:START domain-containing protein [Salinivirgaceae bacterium]
MKHLLIVVSIILCNQLFSQTEWELKKDNKNIKIYTREINGSPFKEFKAQGLLNGSAEKVIQILKAPDSYINWMPDCANAYLISRNSENSHTHYIENKAPWPVSNRDMVLRSDYEKLANQGYFIKISSQPNVASINKGIVRIEKLSGFWLIEPKDSNKVSITYQIHTDPNGEIPSSIMNAFIVESPFKTLIEIQKLLEN